MGACCLDAKPHRQALRKRKCQTLVADVCNTKAPCRGIHFACDSILTNLADTPPPGCSTLVQHPSGLCPRPSCPSGPASHRKHALVGCGQLYEHPLQLCHPGWGPTRYSGTDRAWLKIPSLMIQMLSDG